MLEQAEKVQEENWVEDEIESANHTAQITHRLEEYCVPASDGAQKLLYLLKLL